MSNQKTVADVLFDNKLLSEEQLNLVKLESYNTDRLPEEIISNHGFATVEQLTRAKGKLLGIPYAEILTKGMVPEILTFVPEPVARRYNVIPFSLDQKTNTLSVAMINPLDLQVIDFLEKKTGKLIKPFIASPDDLKTALNEQYAGVLSTKVSAVLQESTPQLKKEGEVKTIKIEEIIRQAPVAKIVATILEYAIKSRASDVHIEPLEDRSRVRYRIDGMLHEKLILPKRIHESVISRIKILSDLKIDEKRVPQDGRFNFKAGNEEVDLRISTLPTVNGEKVVMRLLKKSGGVPTLPELGLRGLALKNLETNMLRPHGIILITGPTGSGKTTTLYAILTRVNTGRVNIVTVEDPVEYQITGINQVQINPAAGLTFASGLRAFLRQDPNVIMVGEIRDTETADLAIQASLTGHLVFSTLHTNNAAGALPRLLDMKAEPFLIASSVTAIVAQRVCRRICPHCKESYVPLSPVIEDLKKVLGKLYPSSSGNLKLWKGKGCEECNKTGYLGRIGIFEVLPLSDRVGKLVLERAASIDLEKQAIEEGMTTIKQDGYLKAIEGITTLEEVLRVAQE